MTGAERAAFSAALADCDAATVDYCPEGTPPLCSWLHTLRPAAEVGPLALCCS